jgi:hypothetical protein
MVYIEQAKVGDMPVKGVGGLVLANTPPDAGLAQVVELSGFELGGYLNTPLLKTMKVTYSLPVEVSYGWQILLMSYPSTPWVWSRPPSPFI